MYDDHAKMFDNDALVKDENLDYKFRSDSETELTDEIECRFGMMFVDLNDEHSLAKESWVSERDLPKQSCKTMLNY